MSTQTQPPNVIAIYLGNFRIVGYVLLVLVMVQIDYAFISSDYQQHYEHASIGLYVTLSVIFGFVPVAALGGAPKVLRHTYWLKNARPYLSLTPDGINLLGDATLSWSSISFVRLLKLKVGRGIAFLLLVGLEPSAQVRDRSFVSWPDDVKERSKEVAENLAIDENSFLSLDISGLTLGFDKVAGLAEMYFAAAHGNALTDDQVALARSFATHLSPLPDSTGARLVKRLSWALLFCWIAAVGAWINGGQYWFFASLDQSAHLQSLGLGIVGSFLVLHLVLLGLLSACRRPPGGKPMTIRRIVIPPLLSLVVAGPLAYGLVASGFRHTLPSVLNEQYGMPFSNTYLVSEKRVVTKRTETHYLAYLAGEVGLEPIRVSLNPSEYRQVEIGNPITVSGVRSSYGLRVRGYYIPHHPSGMERGIGARNQLPELRDFHNPD